MATKNAQARRRPALIEPLEPRLLLDADPQAVWDGLDSFLGVFADGMDESVLAVRIPLLGDGLEGAIDFVREMRGALDDAYADIEARESAKDPADRVSGNQFVREMVFQAWAVTKNLLVDDNGLPITQWQDVPVQTAGDRVQFDCHLYADILAFDQQFDLAEGVDFDTGFELLSLDIEGQATFSVGFDWQLNFGVVDQTAATQEFYVDAEATASGGGAGEMEFTVAAAIPDLQAEGTFLHMGVSIADEDADDNDLNAGVDVDGDGLLPSELRGVFTIDVVDPGEDAAADGLLTQTEFEGAASPADLIDAHLTGGLTREINGYEDVKDYCLVDINLAVDVNWGGAEQALSFGDNETDGLKLPHYSFEFRLAWFLFEMETTRAEGGDGFVLGADQLDRIPVVEFNHISFHLGEFVSSFAGPVLQAYQWITAPVKPLVEWFNAPIPIISDLAGDDSLSLAKICGFVPKYGKIIDALNRIISAVQFAEAFPTDEDITFDFGNFRLYDDIRALNELKDDVENIVNNTLDYLPLEVGDDISQDLYDFLTENSNQSELAGFRFPLLTDPAELVRLILGGDASIIEYVIPDLAVHFDYDQSFPLFPPFLSVGLEGNMDVGLRLGFGFDTYGLSLYANSGDIEDIFQGFYLKDSWDGQDLPEAYLDLGVKGKAFAGIGGLIEAGARGGLDADIAVNLHDSDSDGRVRFFELKNRLDQGWYCMFDATGALSAFLEAYVWVGLDLGFLGEITIFEDSYTIAAGEIFSFRWSCPENNNPPELARLVADAGWAVAGNGDLVPAGTPGSVPIPAGTLVLNMGPRADNRGDSGFGGCTVDKSESFAVSQEDLDTDGDGQSENVIVVRALGFEQYFDPAKVNHIYAEGGAGNDTIRIKDSVVTTGTNGQVATATLYGDFHTDTDDGPEPVVAGKADDGIKNEDKLYTGPGGGVMYGGDGNDRLRGGDGPDVMYGGSGDDHMTGDDGDDVMWGGSNEDTLRGRDGDDQLNGGSEDDRIYGDAGSDQLAGDAGDDILKGGADDDQLTGGDGDDVLLAGGGDDQLTGGDGDDNLDAGSGDDRLAGEAGRDTLVGGPGNDAFRAGPGDDLLFGDNGVVGDSIRLELDADGNVEKIFAVVQLYDTDGVTPLTNPDGTPKVYEIELYRAAGDDQLAGDAGDDILIGDNGASVRDAAGNFDPDQTMALAGPGTPPGDDIYLFENGFGMDHVLEPASAGTDTMDFSAVSDDLDVEFGSIVVTDAAGDKVTHKDNNIEVFISGSGDDNFRITATTVPALHLDGGPGSDTLTGPDKDNTWYLTDDDAWTLDVMDMVNIENIRGGNGSDRFVFGDGKKMSGDLDGRGGYDTMDWSNYTTAVTVDREAQTATGIGGQWFNMENAIGGQSLADHLLGRQAPAEWYVTAPDAGFIDDDADGLAEFDFASFENLTGRDSADRFAIADEAAVTGVIDGGGGTDTMDYSDWSTAVRVDLPRQAATSVFGGFSGGLLHFENATGGAGKDTLTGDELDNVLVGNGDDDILIGLGGDDTLDGGPGSDLARGGEGDDVYQLVPGSMDQVIDPAGIDTLDFSNAASGITIDLRLDAGQEQTVDAAGNIVSLRGTIENVVGSAFDDHLTGNAADNVLAGRAGNDELHGSDGRDRLFGGAGADLLAGEGGDDRLYGGDDADTLAGGPGDDELFGQDGDDVLAGDAGDDQFHGGNGDDQLLGGTGSDLLAGDAGDDLIDGGTGRRDMLDHSADPGPVNVDLSAGTTQDGYGGNDAVSNVVGVIGSVFDDTLTGDAAGNVLLGGAGGDIINGLGGPDELSGQDGDDEIHGGDGADLLDGGPGTDQLFGEAGDDRLNWSAGDDDAVLDGGPGRDSAVVAGTEGADAFAVDALAADLRVELTGPPASVMTAGDVESLSLRALGGSDVVTVGDLGATVLGSVHIDLGPGDDLLDATAATTAVSGQGGPGDDVFQGGAGNDHFVGGAGDDTADYSAAPGPVRVNLTAGRAGRDGAGGRDQLGQIEIVVGSAFDDRLTGSARGDRLAGGAGDDRLRGRAGEDHLLGGPGADDLRGGPHADILVGDAGGDTLRGGGGPDLFVGSAGNDRLIGGAGIDLLDLSAAPAGVVVDLAARTATDALGGNDTLKGIEGARGSAFADDLIGDKRNNVFFGGAGDDRLTGGAGKDLFIYNSGDGNDIIDGGPKADTFRFDGSPGADRLRVVGVGAVARVQDLTTAFAANLDGVETVEVNAGAGDDSLQVADMTGTDLAKVLARLGAGDDLLDGSAATVPVDAAGGPGDDTFRSGAAADRFVGGDGTDLADYSLAPGPVWASLRSRAARDDGQGARDKLLGMENLTGSAFDDELAGSDGANVISGSGGSDIIHGLGGDDLLRGGPGDDELFGDDGADQLATDPGADMLDGGPGTDAVDLTAAAGPATVDLGLAVTLDDGFGGADTLANLEAILGSPFDDALTGDLADNVIHGGGGDDIIHGGGGDDELAGDAGADRLFGDEGDDRLSWLPGDGDDTIDGGAGQDRLDVLGADGQDALQVASAGAVVRVDGVLPGAFGLEIGGVETLHLQTGAGDDVVTVAGLAGTALESFVAELGDGDDLLDGSAATMPLTVYGMAGEDILRGGAGADLLVGGEGTDTADYSAAPAGVTVDLAQGAAIDDGHGSSDQLQGIENLIGSDHDDDLAGDGGANRIAGGGGSDVLRGGPGDDMLLGEGGDDRLFGGDEAAAVGPSGDDELHGGDGDDELFGGDGSDVLAGEAGDDRLEGEDQADSLDGGPGADRLFGGDGDDELFGDDGDDLLAGGDGADVLDGWTGADTLAGENGEDRLQGWSGQDELRGGPGADLLFGEDDPDVIDVGVGGDDVAFGADDDDIDAGKGDDAIDVGAGDDTVRTGPGNDNVINQDAGDTVL